MDEKRGTMRSGNPKDWKPEPYVAPAAGIDQKREIGPIGGRTALRAIIDAAYLLRDHGFDLATVWSYVDVAMDATDRILKSKGHETYGPPAFDPLQYRQAQDGIDRHEDIEAEQPVDWNAPRSRDVSVLDFGRFAHDAYHAARAPDGTLAHSIWNELPPFIKQAWQSAANAVIAEWSSLKIIAEQDEK